MDTLKIIVFIATMGFAALAFRYEIVPADKTAYLLNRWTGEIQFIVSSKIYPASKATDAQ